MEDESDWQPVTRNLITQDRLSAFRDSNSLPSFCEGRESSHNRKKVQGGKFVSKRESESKIKR